ncbi:alpha/beta hydrolase [Candidimonas nitroreducens]|uniref:Carboxylesterase n=1 Tax=Candidimonas nitroreducens TaxID=683354 RepID=A0A225MDW9_9BURK|nr:dienelactone hydrolase family protein [Candidimonas nitroreducens]OWT58260.1 carboxylesterase [Candidimonas nitroreducens]
MNAPLLDCLEIETAPNPSHAVIWLHGLGADGHDFAPIVPELRLAATPAVRFVFPHAPVRPVTLNNGMAMRAWYDITLLASGAREDAGGIRESEAAVRALIARENQRGIATDHIVLAGFSQGCAMTLHTGTRLEQKLAGMIALSGYLPLADSFAAEHSQANLNTPIFMAHGVFDPVVQFAHGQASQRILAEAGFDVSWKTYPMPHSVCPEEITDIGAYLRQVLA